jgi:hypothetical protein
MHAYKMLHKPHIRYFLADSKELLRMALHHLMFWYELPNKGASDVSMARE